MSKPTLEDIVSLAKRRGFIFPSSEIYGGLAGVYDYGPLGVALKHNIQNLWWSSFVTAWDDMYPMDAAILMNKKVWEASGHATGFNDPMVECDNCHSRLRADHVKDSKCPVCGKTDTLSKPKQFNMMFKTQVGAVETVHKVTEEFKDGEWKVKSSEDYTRTDPVIPDFTYLRPETAQGMFVNFKNLLDTVQPDMPFGMAQTGKAFRNEISPRDFLFRLREFDMMEIEYFVHPDKWEEAFEQWRAGMQTFFKKLGLHSVGELDVPEKERAHYSKKTIDFEFDFPFGNAELAGLAYRGDYDLSKHQEATNGDFRYRPKDGSKPFIPHVIEPSFGLDRLVLAILTEAYAEDEQGGEKRTYLKLPAQIAPTKAAVLPLVRTNEDVVNKAREIYENLKNDTGLSVAYDEKHSIGKRYRKQDEIGTPFCITVDFESLEDKRVTIRNRDDLSQRRVSLSDLVDYLSSAT